MIGASLVLVVLWGKGVLRPGSLKSQRAVDAHPWWVWMACAAIIWLILQVGQGVAAQAAGVDLKHPSIGDQAIVMLAGYAVGLACAGVLTRLVSMAAPRAGMSITPRTVLVGVLCGAFAWPIVTCAGFAAAALHQFVSGEPHNPIGHPTLKAFLDNPGNPWAWVLIAIAVLAAPVFEEIVYRGFVQSLILRATGHSWIAIIAASLVFGAVHMGMGIPWYSIVPITVLGIAMGFAFEKTRSLGVPIGMHVFFNAANVAVAVVIGGQGG
ncbi:hypothetical protein PHYC_02902 [Phycisphaerales bacterium]|nr:hypothetical protein PHYC_02902 [Phycisphaerales bacterium]